MLVIGHVGRGYCSNGKVVAVGSKVLKGLRDQSRPIVVLHGTIVVQHVADGGKGAWLCVRGIGLAHHFHGVLDGEEVGEEGSRILVLGGDVSRVVSIFGEAVGALSSRMVVEVLEGFTPGLAIGRVVERDVDFVHDVDKNRKSLVVARGAKLLLEAVMVVWIHTRMHLVNG